MRQLLTHEILDNLPKDREVYDGESGLHIYTRSAGAGLWFIETLDNRIPLKSGIYTIGEYPAMSLQQARAEYKQNLAALLQVVTEKLAYEEAKEKPTQLLVQIEHMEYIEHLEALQYEVRGMLAYEEKKGQS